MALRFIPVKTDKEIEGLAMLADMIWHEYWPALIGEAQTDYMVQQFQTADAIKRDMAEHDYEYWFIADTENETPAELDALGGAAPDGDKSVDAADTARMLADSLDDALRDHDAVSHTHVVGYTGGHNEPGTNRFFISKIYLLASQRGQGYASQTIKFYDRLCADRGLGAMYLTVNKHNDLGIRAYKGKGFETIDSVETDIGNGFIMDDYIMEKKVK